MAPKQDSKATPKPKKKDSTSASASARVSRPTSSTVAAAPARVSSPSALLLASFPALPVPPGRNASSASTTGKPQPATVRIISSSSSTASKASSTASQTKAKPPPAKAAPPAPAPAPATVLLTGPANGTQRTIPASESSYSQKAAQSSPPTSPQKKKPTGKMNSFKAGPKRDAITSHGRPAIDAPDISIRTRPPPPRPGTVVPLPPSDWVQDGEYNTHLSERIGKGNSKFNKSDEITNESNTLYPKHPLLSKFETEMPEPISPWRLRPDIPSVEELLRTDVHIPPNIIDKKWKSVEEYLGSHYELLREDACSTLRDVALTMKVTPSMSDQAALCIYENVRVKGYTFSQLGVGVKISFSLNRARKKILWSQSKRLIPGTLVCLSSDNFQDGKNMKLATVLARPISALELTPPEVDILFLENEIEVDATKQWLMVESRGSYFEAYKHTLRALQRMKDSNFPLNNHIVSLENDIPAPEYLQNDPWFDLSKLSKNTEDDPKFKRCNILEEWPPVDKDDMDANQLNALKRMITKRLAIVQGPPGTGKTYTSVLALKILLSNMKEGDPPIIISCQTNHALDQLLNKIIPFETNIIRLGGRTQDKDEIKKRTLYEKRQTTNIKVKGNSRTRAKAEMLRLQERMATVLEPLTTNIISPAALCALGIITVAQRDAFLNRRSDWVSVQDDSNPEGDMSSWLEGYIIQVEVEHNSYDELEDEDIDAEQLHTMQAEFLGTDVEEREFVLRGQYLELKKSHYVAEPYAVDKRELNEYVKKNNVWDWPQHIRAAAYKRWSALAVQKIAAEVRAINTRYGAVVKDFKIASLERDAYILEGAKVVGMTNTGLAKYRSLIGSIRPRVVMIEEAAESLEGPIITACFPTVEHLILVGDHQQLRPQCNSRELGIAPFNLGISMFERLVNNQIGFDRLKVQFRMRPEIRCLLSPIYDDLTDHKSVLEKPPVEGMGGTNVFFYWHTKLEARDEGTSRLNEHEAEMVVNFTRYLVFNGILPQKITILTFYGGQKNFISRLIRKDAELRPFRHNIQVATVDSYQGEENDIILLSLVRSNTEQVVGFLDVRNRVCVAMSRAQRGFYIFGNGRMLTNANELWWEISQILNSAEPKMLGYNLPLTCQKHKRQIAITELTQWLENKGGCNERCREVRHCGHICTSKCHAFSHENLVCYEKCEKILPCCGLQCPKDCHEECACKRCPIRATDAPTASPPVKTVQISQDIRLSEKGSVDVKGKGKALENNDKNNVEGRAVRTTTVYTHTYGGTDSPAKREVLYTTQTPNTQVPIVAERSVPSTSTAGSKPNDENLPLPKTKKKTTTAQIAPQPAVNPEPTLWSMSSEESLLITTGDLLDLGGTDATTKVEAPIAGDGKPPFECRWDSESLI